MGDKYRQIYYSLLTPTIRLKAGDWILGDKHEIDLGAYIGPEYRFFLHQHKRLFNG